MGGRIGPRWTQVKSTTPPLLPHPAQHPPARAGLKMGGGAKGTFHGGTDLTSEPRPTARMGATQ